MNAIASYDKLNDDEKNSYFNALTHLQNISTDSAIWSFLNSSFSSLRLATHALVFEESSNCNNSNPHLQNALIQLQRAIEEIISVPLRVSIKEIEFSNNESTTVRTICDTDGNTNKKSYPLKNYYGLYSIFKKLVMTTDDDYWLCSDVVESIYCNQFSQGSFSSEKFNSITKNTSEIPYKSSLCLPIYNIDLFSNNRVIIRGFLCLDTKQANQFKNESIRFICSSFCDFLYIFLTAKNYLKNKAIKEFLISQHRIK